MHLIALVSTDGVSMPIGKLDKTRSNLLISIENTIIMMKIEFRSVIGKTFAASADDQPLSNKSRRVAAIFAKVPLW
jgi:hypothetical protein